MRIAAHSISRSVRRTLESAILASGHQVAATTGQAEFLLVDGVNPPADDPIPLLPRLLLGRDSGDAAIACPLRPAHLIQRLTMLGTTQPIALGNGWVLDLQGRLLTHPEGTNLTVTEKECVLLKYLLKAHPSPLPRVALLEQVWGMATDIDTHTLETHVYRLRSKLEGVSPIPGDIVTEDGAYRWVM